MRHGAHLRLDEPALLPASSVAVLEEVGGVHGDAVVGVVQRGKVVPVGGQQTAREGGNA